MCGIALAIRFQPKCPEAICSRITSYNVCYTKLLRDLLSPPNHQGLYSIEESVQKMFLSFNAAFKFRVPVAIKVAASATSVSVFNNLVRDPYNIVGGFFLDGIDGGTGAAHEVSLDHTGHPIVSKLRDCYLAAVAQGRQGQIVITSYSIHYTKLYEWAAPVPPSMPSRKNPPTSYNFV